MSVAEIRKFLLSFEISNPLFQVPKGAIPLAQSLTFSNVQHMTIKEGTYTPANDYVYMWQSIPVDKAPNFLAFMGQGTFNITVNANGVSLWNSVPVYKSGILLLPQDSLYKIDNIYIEGRTNVGSPMAQGVSQDYFCVMAQAVF